MRPLFVTAITAISAVGRGDAGTLAALRERRSGLRACDFEDVTGGFIGRVRGSRRTAAGRRSPALIAATTVSPTWHSARDGFAEHVGGGTRASSARAASGSSSAPAPPASSPARRPIAPAIPSAARCPRISTTPNARHGLAGPLRARRARAARAGDGRLRPPAPRRRTGVRRRPPSDRGRRLRCGGGGRRRQSLPHDLARLRRAGAALPGPCRPVRCDAQRALDRRGGGLRAARAADRTARRGAARLRREQRRPPHVGAAPEAARRGRGDATQALRRRRAARRRDRLREPARHRHPRERCDGGCGGRRACSAPRSPCSSTKGWTGHTLGAAGIVEAISRRWHPPWAAAGLPQPDRARPGAPRRGADGECRAAGPPRDQQLLRLRRHQLQPAAGHAGDARVSMRACRSGVRGCRAGTKRPPVLAGQATRSWREPAAPAPAMLSATERRRASASVRLALAVADAASPWPASRPIR